MFEELSSQTKQQMANNYYEQHSINKTNVKVGNLTKTLAELDLDTLNSWSTKNVKYWNLFVFSTARFRSSTDLRRIWNANFKNDPYNTCENFRNVLDFENSQFNYAKTAPLLYVHLLSEYDYYDTICRNYFKIKSQQIANQLSKVKNYYNQYNAIDKVQNEIHQNNLKLVETIINDLGKYPGRSIVGIEYEDVAYVVIKHSSIEIMEKYLSSILNATVAKDLDPKFGAYLADRISFLRKTPQEYGTEMRGDKPYKLKHSLELTNKLRLQVGLKPLTNRN